MAFDIISFDGTSQDTKLGIKLEFNNDKVINSSVTNAEKTLANLKTLLLTRVGERYMQPEFGTRLADAIFEPNTDEIVTVLNDYITTAINKWLPEITITSIDIKSNDDDKNRHIIHIQILFNINNERSNRTISVFVNESGIFEIVEE